MALGLAGLRINWAESLIQIEHVVVIGRKNGLRRALQNLLRGL
jgi:hypothetical protein